MRSVLLTKVKRGTGWVTNELGIAVFAPVRLFQSAGPYKGAFN